MNCCWHKLTCSLKEGCNIHQVPQYFTQRCMPKVCIVGMPWRPFWFAYVPHSAASRVCSQINTSAGCASGVSEGSSPGLPQPRPPRCSQDKQLQQLKGKRGRGSGVRSQEPGKGRMALLALVSTPGLKCSSNSPHPLKSP